MTTLIFVEFAIICLLVAFIIIWIVAEAIVQITNYKKISCLNAPSILTGVFDENTIVVHNLKKKGE